MSTGVEQEGVRSRHASGTMSLIPSVEDVPLAPPLSPCSQSP